MQLKHFIFIEKINEVIKKNILASKNVTIIINIYHKDRSGNKSDLSIVDFAKKSKVPFLIVNSFKAAIKFKANGVFIDSKNKNINKPLILPKEFLIIGSAHNQLEYNNKLKQTCKTISLSPIFFNKKYSKNKILEIVKFNLITKNWQTQICALGGVNEKTLKKIKLTRSNSIAYNSYIKKPNYRLR